jgi:hypothetical protein
MMRRLTTEWSPQEDARCAPCGKPYRTVSGRPLWSLLVLMDWQTAAGQRIPSYVRLLIWGTDDGEWQTSIGRVFHMADDDQEDGA